jgi:two-component system, OmpR family, response regulator ResD
MSDVRRVLVVDDDPNVCELMRMYLERDGFEVVRAADGDAAVAQTRALLPDVVLLDIMMPGIDGYEVLRRIRAYSHVPVMFLSCKDADVESIVGLELGADDYIAKPFNPREVVARIRAVLRRTTTQYAPAPSVRVVGSLTIDRSAYRVEAPCGEIRLAPRELELLWFLASRPGILHAREDIMRHVWGYVPEDGDTRTVDTHVKRLRRKIAECGCTSCAVEVVWGRGYRLVVHPGA